MFNNFSNFGIHWEELLKKCAEHFLVLPGKTFQQEKLDLGFGNCGKNTESGGEPLVQFRQLEHNFQDTPHVVFLMLTFGKKGLDPVQSERERVVARQTEVGHDLDFHVVQPFFAFSLFLQVQSNDLFF